MLNLKLLYKYQQQQLSAVRLAHIDSFAAPKSVEICNTDCDDDTFALMRNATEYSTRTHAQMC